MKHNKTLLRTVVSIAVVFSLWLGVGGLPVLAADPSNAVLNLELQTVTQRDGTEYQVLAAKLSREDGYPLSERTITFMEMVNVYGDGRIVLGSVVTTAFGVATIKYETRLLGSHQFVAIFAGDQEALAAQVTKDIEITSTSLPPLSPPTGMESITNWASLGAGIVFIAICVLLLSIIFRVFRDVPSSRGEVIAPGKS